MFQKHHLTTYIKWGVIAAIVFSIPMFLFVKANDYQSAWWLYLGNAMFLVVIASSMLTFSKRREHDASTQNMIAAGHMTTLVGIIISCLVAVIAILIYIPDVFSSGVSDSALVDAPAQTGDGKTHGLIFFVFMNATIGNFCGGSFASIIIPYTVRRNQTKDKKSRVLNN